MAHKLIDQTYRPYVNAPLCEFICDTDADVANLPQCCTGSKALSVATGITHMVNASGYWVPFGGGIVGGSLEGDGQEFHQFAPTTLAFRSTEPLEEFQEVKVNDETVDPENYDLEEGSTIVKFKPDFLKTLGNGKHKVAIVSKNNVVSGNFNVKVPEVNEHGFYYNQPYTANLPMFGGDTAFFVREDGTFDIITVGKDLTTSTYTVNGNNIVAIVPPLGTVNCTISTDGTSIYCNEVATTFELNGSIAITADDDYVYEYKEELGGYEAKCIDKTKAEYGAIKTGINGIDTVKLADDMFANIYVDDDGDLVIGAHALSNVPYIPDTVKIIGDNAFNHCGGFASIELPVGIEVIGIHAFSTNLTLAHVVLHPSVTTIGDWAFYYCYNLTSITFKGTIAQWNAIQKGDLWNYNVPATHVQCTDGTVAL